VLKLYESPLLAKPPALDAVLDESGEVSHLCYDPEKKALFVRYFFRPRTVYCFVGVELDGERLSSGEIGELLRRKLASHDQHFAISISKYLYRSAIDKIVVNLLPPVPERPPGEEQEKGMVQS